MSGETTRPSGLPPPDDPHAPWRPPGWTPPVPPDESSSDAEVRRLTPAELVWSPTRLRDPGPGQAQPPGSAASDAPAADAAAESGVLFEQAHRPRRPRLRTIVAGAGVAALVAVPAATVVYLRAAGGTSDVLVGRAVPGGATVYATLRLDPSLSTKQHLRDLLDRFPSVHNDPSTTVTSWVRGAVRGSGLDYDRDVQPWLGSQIAVVGLTGTTSGYAALLVSTDDGKASAALRATQSESMGQSLTWTTVNRGGVAVNIGKYPQPDYASGYTCTGCTNRTGYVWAVVDHVAVVGSAEEVVDSVIDTEQGKEPALGAMSLYNETMSRLSSDRVAEVFVDAAPLLDSLHRSQAQGGSGSLPSSVGSVFKALDAYRSVGMALTVASDHVDLDAVTLTDPTKLPAQSTPAGPSLASWLPASSVAVTESGGGAPGGPAAALSAVASMTAYSAMSLQPHGVTAYTTVPQQPSAVIQLPPASAGGSAILKAPSALATPAGLPPGSAPPTLYPAPRPAPIQSVAVPAPQSVIDQQTLSHLNGPSAAGAWAGADGSARAALVLTGDGTVNLGDALDRVLRALTTSPYPTCTVVEQPGGAQSVQCTTASRTPVHTDHAGITIGSYSGAVGAWAVVNGVGILGTSPEAVADVLDAHSSGSSAAKAPGFSGSRAGSTGGGLWVDIQASLSLIRSALAPGQRSALDDAMPNLRPLRTLVASTGGDNATQTLHLELTLG